MKTTKNHVYDLQIALPCALNGFCCFHFDLWETRTLRGSMVGLAAAFHQLIAAAFLRNYFN